MRQERFNTLTLAAEDLPKDPIEPVRPPRKHQKRAADLPQDLTVLPLIAGLCSLVFVIYGHHLREGLLADDFLYTAWLDQGPAELLRRLTTTSNPRMIRPFPALGWWLASVFGGVFIQHAVSLLLHGLCAVLVARLAERSQAGAGLPAALLFVTFPLFAEPVIWLSSAFDLWAAFFALAALLVGLSSSAPHRRPLTALLFTLSLLSKESTLLLPLVPFCLPAVAPFELRRRLATDLAMIAGAYLLLRLLMFGGPGGYLDSAGHSIAWGLDPFLFFRNALLQFPYRLLIPLKRAGELAPVLALASTVLGGMVLATAKPWQKPRRVLLALSAFLIALAPTAPVFGIDFDHENSRMLYFPVAMLCIAGAATGKRPTPWWRGAVVALALFWGVVSIANGTSWSEANRELRGTLLALEEHQEEFPPVATVLIAGHDTWHGAYAWRNALYLATRRAGLRHDIDWRLGTAALINTPQLLGESIFELDVDPVDPIDPIDPVKPLRDLTQCQRTLHLHTPQPLAVFFQDTLRQRRSAFGPRGRLNLPPVPLLSSTLAPAVLVSAKGGLRHPIEGRLFWRASGVGRFNVTDARRFRIAPGPTPRTIIRLAWPYKSAQQLEIRLETEAAEALEALTDVRVLEGGALCLPADPSKTSSRMR
jgi:hypothetical protein